MKYKKKVKWLKDKQAWWDKQGKDFQAATLDLVPLKLDNLC